ncbi:hypothetical protein AURDEDRAFT_156688 [Auricularia subglabra TFB-10046 SS5]|nr:hypothetical protein AURDEDRAFT_156688 [Auricularia subglabra TFB-10046 SS5]
MSLEAARVTHESQSRYLQTALAKSGELQGELAAEPAFRAELANTKRMVAMLERRQEEAHGRIEEVDREWNDLTNRTAQIEDKLRREIDREHARADDLERQPGELHAVMDHMASGDLPASAAGETNGNVGNGFVYSPTASMKHETKRLEDCLAQILADIEERAALLQEQCIEYEQLAVVLKERDIYAQRAREGEQKERALLHEQELLRQQLQDVGRPLQALLREQTLHENPGLVLVELDKPASGAGALDTVHLISEQLVLFKSITELREQNARLLAIIRDLGARMERQEAMQRAREEVEDSALLREAKRPAAQAHAEAKEGSASAVSSADFAEAQRNFDTYRLEIREDNRRLKEDLLAAQREVGAVDAANAKITTLEEHFRNASQKRAKDSLQARAEMLRNQVVQLKAEREAFKSVGVHLSAENRGLASQCTHLTDLMSSLRKMQKDLEVAKEGGTRPCSGARIRCLPLVDTLSLEGRSPRSTNALQDFLRPGPWYQIRTLSLSGLAASLFVQSFPHLPDVEEIRFLYVASRELRTLLESWNTFDLMGYPRQLYRMRFISCDLGISVLARLLCFILHRNTSPLHIGTKIRELFVEQERDSGYESFPPWLDARFAQTVERFVIVETGPNTFSGNI